MINEKKVMAIVPARGGSKGIKNKNIINLNGKPLIAYTIEAAFESKYIDSVFVSTDSEKIKSVAEKFGARVPFLRPNYLASDTAKTIDVVIHMVNYLGKEKFDILVLLQPTSPLRTGEDIDGAIEIYMEMGGCEDVVAVSPTVENPVLVRTIDSNGYLKSLLCIGSTVRRQDMDVFYRVNGSIYVNAVERINSQTSFNDNKIPFIMGMSHGVDIDEEIDLMVAEYYLNETVMSENHQ